MSAERGDYARFTFDFDCINAIIASHLFTFIWQMASAFSVNSSATASIMQGNRHLTISVGRDGKCIHAA